MMISIHQQMFRQLSVSNTSHSITRNTLLLPQPSQKSSAKALSLVDSGPSTQTFSHAQKHANKRLPFQTLVTIPTIGFTHFSWWRVLSSVIRSPWQKHQERKRTGNMRIKTRKWTEGKVIFLPWKFWFWRKIDRKKSEKCSKNWKKNKRAKKDIYRTFFYNEACFKKKKHSERRPDATDVPRPRSMTTECT